MPSLPKKVGRIANGVVRRKELVRATSTDLPESSVDAHEMTATFCPSSFNGKPKATVFRAV